MFFNSVYQSSESSARYRVLFEQVDCLMLIDIDDANAWPFQISIESFDSADYEAIEDPYTLPDVEEGSVAQQKRDEALAVLQPLLEVYPCLFDKRERNRLIKDRLSQITRPRLYLTRQLRRYWQRGIAPNALVPDLHHCGGAGKSRRQVENKVGRKRSVSSGVGTIITDEVAELFQLAIEGFYLASDKIPFKEAQTKAIGLYRSRFVNADQTNVPTMAQFRYYYQTHYKASEVVKKRTPSRVYDKDIRALTSTSGYMNHGPGARYEIDATIGDIYLVSDEEPEKIIGRPVIYFVKDVFSRMVVGLYVGLENPSWVAAMIALANAFSDKVDFCSQYGISISSDQWPSVGIPAGIMADRGELLYRQADVLVNRFGIQLSNARAYRGDDKAICERAFNTIQAQFRLYAEGIVEPVNGKKRIGKRYELDAELSLSAFTELIIKLVINHNNRHVVDGYDFAPDMPEYLPAVPVQLWNWGISNRTGRLKPCDETLAAINLLPYEKASVSEVGIKFKGLSYTCPQAIQEGWFDRFKHQRPSKVTVCFDPRRTNRVYLRPTSKFEDYWVCDLSDRSRRYRGMSFYEAENLLRQARQTEAVAKQYETFNASDMQKEIEDLVARERDKKTANPSGSITERLSGIRGNRHREKELGRDRSGDPVNSEPANQGSLPAEVIDIRSASKPSQFDYPDLDSYLDDDDD